MVIFHSYVTVYQRVTNLWFPVVPSISEKSPVAPLLASPSQWTLEIVGPTMKSVLCYGAGCSTSRNQSFTYYKMMVFLHHGFSLLPAVTVIMLHIITGESLASLKRPAKVIAPFLVGEHHSSTPKTSFQEVSKDITNHNFYRLPFPNGRFMTLFYPHYFTFSASFLGARCAHRPVGQGWTLNAHRPQLSIFVGSGRRCLLSPPYLQVSWVMGVALNHPF